MAHDIAFSGLPSCFAVQVRAKYLRRILLFYVAFFHIHSLQSDALFFPLPQTSFHQLMESYRHHMLHLRFVQTVIACASDAHASYGLGKRGLDACSGLIGLPKCRGFLFVSPRLQGFMSGLWTQV